MSRNPGNWRRDTLDGLAGVLGDWLKCGGEALDARLELASLDKHYVDDLAAMASEMRARDAASAKGKRSTLSQGALDRQDGLNILLLGQVLRCTLTECMRGTQRSEATGDLDAAAVRSSGREGCGGRGGGSADGGWEGRVARATALCMRGSACASYSSHASRRLLPREGHRAMLFGPRRTPGSNAPRSVPRFPSARGAPTGVRIRGASGRS